MTDAARIPASYASSRAHFLGAAAAAGAEVSSHPIDARGPGGEALFVDVAVVGDRAAPAVLLVLSGVHGVEGFVTSAMQVDLLVRLARPDRPPLAGARVVLVHAVNPWGMTHGRRQNESNVDLNRNWGRSGGTPERNEAYDRVHHLACPDTDDVPAVERLLAEAAAVVESHGEAWLRNAITRGQFHHPDGLHFGGHRTEVSCRILEDVVPGAVGQPSFLVVIDLHTGHGPYAALTLLCDRPEGSAQHRYLVDTFAGIEVTIEAAADPHGANPRKQGAIARGIAELVGATETMVTTPEVGTAGDLEQLVATYQEQWVHRCGDTGDPAHAEVRAAYRRCFTPDDAEWEADARALGAQVLDAALDSVRASR